MTAPTLFDDDEVTRMWSEAVEAWSPSYTCGDPETALRFEFRRRHHRNPEDATPRQMRRFLSNVQDGTIR